MGNGDSGDRKDLENTEKMAWQEDFQRAVANMEKGFAERCALLIPQIREYLARCRVKGADEKGLRAESLHWLHVVCNDKGTYLYADRKRGFEAIEKDELLIDSLGALIHDCWSPYFQAWECRACHMPATYTERAEGGGGKGEG